MFVMQQPPNTKCGFCLLKSTITKGNGSSSLGDGQSCPQIPALPHLALQFGARYLISLSG